MKNLAPITILIFLSCDGEKEIVLDRWDNGNIKTMKIIYNERDTLQCVLLSYFSSGNKKERVQVNGKSKNGWDIRFYEKGTVADSTFYRDNAPVATTIHFFFNGKIEYSGQFDDSGKRQGDWIVYDSAGQACEKTDYAGGIKMRTFKYDKTGQLIKELKYQEGSGLVDEEKTYRDGVPDGPYQKYFNSGQLQKTGSYNKGSREGESWKEYHNNGRLFKEYLFTGKYDQDFKILNVWDENGNQKVINGNGEYRDTEYCPNGMVRATTMNKYVNGEVVDTKKSFGACR